MAEILACRACLATDVKLFDVYSNNLVSAFEMVIGIQVTETDGLPSKMCSYCSVLLMKSAGFKERCLNSQELLAYLAEREVITTDFLRQMDRSTNPSLPTFTIKTAFTIDLKQETIEFKEEDIDYADVDLDIDNDIKSEASDEEPLSKIVEKRNDFLPEIKEEIDSPQIDLIFLSKEEQLEELKEKMTSLNYINSLYKCEFCYKGFMTDVTYKNHMVRHDSKMGSYRCEICSIYCSSERRLKGHVANSHERNYICKLCEYVTKSGSRAREHSRWHSGHKYICQPCGKSFSKSTSYLTHVRLRHPSKHCCSLCGESFIGQNGLNIHVKKAHAHQDLSRDLQKCEDCGAMFQSEEVLRRHRELKDCDINNRPCSQCGENFQTDDILKEHTKTVHDATKCEECGKTFSSERSYAIHHQRFHLGLRLKRQVKRRNNIPRKVVCELCGKACHSKANLIYHQRTHTGERPYHCKQCPKKFANLQLLQVHIRTHTGERPYKCDVCFKAFIHKAGLNRHVRVHTGEKPYSCPHCDKSFTQSNSMKLHVNTVHLKMPAPYRARKKEYALQ